MMSKFSISVSATSPVLGPSSSTSPSHPLKTGSAWSRGPPRTTLSGSSKETGMTSHLPLIPNTNPISPISPPTLTLSSNSMETHGDFSTASPQDSPSARTASTNRDPPSRPRRNPARMGSMSGVSQETQAALRQEDTGMTSPSQQRSEPSTGALHSATSMITTPNWSALLSQSRPAPPVSTETSPVLTESNSKSRSQSRDNSTNEQVEGHSEMPIIPTLPPLPAYPPPVPPNLSSKSRLQPNAQPFVPIIRRPSAAIIIKNAKGEEIDVSKLKKPASAGSGEANNNSINFAPAISSVIRMESEEGRRQRLHPTMTDKAQDVPSLTVITNAETENNPTEGEQHEDDEMESPDEMEDTENVSAGADGLQDETLPSDQDTVTNDGEQNPSSQTVVVPTVATSPPTAPLDGTFPTAPPVREKRERSRRSSHRRAERSNTAEAAGNNDAMTTMGLNAMTRTRSGNMTRTRSGEPRKRTVPGRLDLSGIPKPSPISSGNLASAITSARMITNIYSIAYPIKDGITAPETKLNEGVEDGKFRYDRNFLLQFRGLCTEKPPGMAELEEIGLEPAEQPAPTRSGRRRRSVRSNAEPTLPTPLQSAGPGITTLPVPSTPLTIRTSEDGLTLPVTPLSAVYSPPPVSMTRTGSRGGRSRTSSGANKSSIITPTALAPPFPIVRSTSHGSSRPSNSTLSSGLPPPSPLDRRSKSLKARKRSSSTRTDQPPLPGLQRASSGLGSLSHESSGILEDVQPLEKSENRWIPSSIGVSHDLTLSGVSSVTAVESPELVEKKVKALLNKLTLEKFDSISDQIVAWANKSENETDGATLNLVIRLVFEKATDEATWSGMYARLCRKMMEQISTHVIDENVRDREGRSVVGGQLFRQYLLSRCQADFERGWSARETLEEQQSAAAAASGAAPGEIVFSDEYYALQKAKRRGLGLVKFIGELFKLQMLTERIMHRCILKLLDEPAEEDIESVCQLLKTVGAALSGPKGRETMDMYFGKMVELSQDPSISQRIRFMLLDVIDLRARNWIPKTQIAAPSTLSQVHEEASKEKNDTSTSTSTSTSTKPIPIGRERSRRGQNRGEANSQKDMDGWGATPGGRSLSKMSGVSLTSTLASSTKTDESERLKSPITAKSPMASSNGSFPLARLSSEPGMSRMTRNPSEPGKSRSRRGGENRQVNRRTSVDFVQLDAAIDTASSGRKRLQLLPRTVGAASNPSEDKGSLETPLAATIEEAPAITEEQAKAKVEEDVKEFMAIKDLNEAMGYFEALPSTYRHLLVEKFVSKIDAKDSDVALISQLFLQVSTAGTCSTEVFEHGFKSTIEALDDIALDVPSAYKTMAKLLRGSRLSRECVSRLAQGIVTYGEPIVHPRDVLMKEYDTVA
ncbi:hypothetical protein CPB86DRAFT_531314 [Serendipita vermifera]|nr:hypothetical protein CPB86DRAFT_531314 [Serendipita vermifera]